MKNDELVAIFNGRYKLSRDLAAATLAFDAANDRRKKAKAAHKIAKAEYAKAEALMEELKERQYAIHTVTHVFNGVAVSVLPRPYNVCLINAVDPDIGRYARVLPGAIGGWRLFTGKTDVTEARVAFGHRLISKKDAMGAAIDWVTLGKSVVDIQTGTIIGVFKFTEEGQ